MTARATVCLLIASALGGCTLISDFDFEFTDEDGGPAMDGGDTDAGPRFDAAGVDAGPATDAGPGVDAGAPPPRCPMPCLGDATNDWSGAQDSGALTWRYHEDARGPFGLDFPELAAGTFDGIDGFGAAMAPPLVASCDDNASAAECAGLAGHLLVRGDPPGGGSDPVISFQAPSRGVIRVQGRIRLPDGVASAESLRVTISRNARHDYAASSTIIPTTTPAEIDELVDVLPGDRVLVIFEQRTGAMPVPFGVQLWVTRMGVPPEDRCLVGLPFDEPTPLRDLCGELDVDNLTDGIGSPPGPSTLGAGASPLLGEARDLVEGQYLRVGSSPIDYSGDFTVQVWARVTPGASFIQAFYADSTSDAPPGGVSISMSSGQGYARTFHPRGSGTCVSEPVPGVCLVGSSLGTISEGEWHFFRMSRSTADDEILVCVDGQRRARLAVDGALDLTTSYAPHLGRNVVFNPAYMDGSLDDVRVYEVALPCEL